MNLKWIFHTAVIFSVPFLTFGNSKHTFHSKYDGQESREIKSLSEVDIDELTNGKGWGLAKAAELNGVPGPVHLLEMKEEIHLSQNQIKQITSLYQEMKHRAIPLGLKLIQLEKELNKYFADGLITDEKLQDILGKIAQTNMQLRYIHLSTHLKTPKILASEQIDLYNKLRGYSRSSQPRS